MKLSMTSAGDGEVQVRAEDNGRVYTFKGRITRSELNADHDSIAIDSFGPSVLRSGPRYRYILELDVDDICMGEPVKDVGIWAYQLAADMERQLYSVPQRYVVGMPATVEEVSEVVEEVEDIPSDWIDLDGA